MVQPGRHGVTVFVGIVALIIGLVFGFQLGRGSDNETTTASDDFDTDADAPTVSIPPPTTAPPTDPTTDPSTSPTTEPSGDPTEPLGSLSNPIPVGQGWILGIWQLEVKKTDFDASRRVTDASSRNPAPPDGSVYVLIDIELTLLDDVFVFAEDFLPTLLTADGDEILNRFGSCGPEIPDNFYDHGRLSTDDPARGNLCFAVPTDDIDGLLLTTEGVGDTATHFALD